MRPRTRYQWERAIRCLEILPPARKLVALVLATYANNDGTNARPGEVRLARNCGISQRAVRGHLAALRDLGLIVRTFQASSAGRKNFADSYDLNMPSDTTQPPEACFR